ncbi:copper resistance protein CopC [Actinoplanes sp. NPDC026670]|uniref:copper resistance CopC/CopD family protein n=1 Tax=Actinoplanes sp. NPDC026670 TaxID=3154700 RepID=UPI0033C111BF
MIRRLGATVLLLVALLLGTAQPVSAHADLVRSDPAQGAVLATAPTRILLTFDETVRGVPDGVQIFDARGDLVEARTTVTGAELTVDPAGSLGTGTTVLTWRVVSDDGHPISGALSFSIGAPTGPAVTLPAAEPTTVPDVPWALTLLRWLGYAGLLLAAGLVVFATFFLSGGSSRLLVAVRVSAAVAAGAWIAALPIMAVYLLGGGPTLLTRATTWSSLPPTDYIVAATVAGGLAAAVALLGRLADKSTPNALHGRQQPAAKRLADKSTPDALHGRQQPAAATTVADRALGQRQPAATKPADRLALGARLGPQKAAAATMADRPLPVEPPGRRRIAAVVAALIAAAAPALTGHTRSANPEALAIAADVLHLLAGSVWLGGLAGLALTLPGLAGRAAAAETLARFSTAAAIVLTALVATGTLLGWRILGSWSALVNTDYGRLLLAKITIALVAVAIAAWNRWSLLPRIQQAPRRPERTRPVVRAVTIEGALLLAALLVTGSLVDTSPEASPASTAAATEADRGPRITTLGDIQVQAGLAPLTRGANTITLRMISATGEPAEGVAPPVVRLSSDRASLGAVPLTQVSPGFYTAQVTIPAPGTWRMQVSLRVTEFTNPVAELDFDIS